MKLWMIAALAALPTVANAQLAPVSYDETHPGNGSYSYQDDGYTGTDNGSTLSGGTGELTNGIIPTAHWYDSPGPWVGWADVDPVITFHFGGVADISGVSFWFDNAQGAGGVSLPLLVSFSTAQGAVVPTGASAFYPGPLGVYHYDFTGLSTDTLTATISRSNQWTMLGEVTFSGSLEQQGPGVPEPASWALMVSGFGLAGAAMRRGRTSALSRP